jgi:PAS domain S-box-containing protein
MQTASDKKPLRVLIIEDSEFDARTLVNALRKGGYEPVFQRLDTPDEMAQALASNRWDVVLADYNMPKFNAPAALQMLQQSGQDLPFIIVSGGIGEDIAVAAMKAGAHDYLMKGNLARLVPAVERELREAETRAAKHEAEEALKESELRYRLLWENSTDAVLLIDTENRILFANPALEVVFGYDPHEIVGQNLTLILPDRLLGDGGENLAQALREGVRSDKPRILEAVGIRKNGSEVLVEIAFNEMQFHGHRWFVMFIRDITERKRSEQELRDNQEQFRVAREIQQRLFPKAPPDFGQFDIAGASYPAEATGGDYYDFLPMVDGCMGIVVADVTGHGVGPALLMAETRAYLRILARNRENVGEILTRANRMLAEDVDFERFVTLTFAKLDSRTQTLTYASAGHPSGYVLDAAGQIKSLLKRTGVPLGIQADFEYPSATPIELVPGDIILLVTDGVEEAVSPADELFGVQRTLDVVREHAHESAEQILAALYKAVRDFSQDQAQFDDLTVVVVKVKPAPEGPR